MLRYECWRTRDDRRFVLGFEGRWDEIPLRLTSLGPWVGASRGWVEDLKAHYRILLAEQSFVVFCRKPTAMQLERYKHRVKALPVRHPNRTRDGC